MKVVDIEDIQVGDLVQLRWNGYPGVPGWLHGGWATVERKARTRVAVRARSEAQDGHPPRWVRIDQIVQREAQEAP
jgi:hypothetical protein